MPNMPIYTQQTTPNGNMAVQAQAVNVRDPYGPAIQDLGQGMASLGQNLGNIQRVQIERANQLQADKDDLWAASTVADIDIKMTKRMADLSVDPTVTELTPVIEKEIDAMLAENGKDASDPQKKLLDKRSVGFRRELITAAIGRDVAHSIATTEARLGELGQSRASKIAFNAPDRTWDPAERAVAAWKADQEVSAEIDKAHIAPQQKLVQKTKLKAGLIDAYMGRFVEVDPDMAMAALSGEIKDGPVAEIVKQIPASAIDSYASRAQQESLRRLTQEHKQREDFRKETLQQAENYLAQQAFNGTATREMVARTSELVGGLPPEAFARMENYFDAQLKKEWPMERAKDMMDELETRRTEEGSNTADIAKDILDKNPGAPKWLVASIDRAAKSDGEFERDFRSVRKEFERSQGKFFRRNDEAYTRAVVEVQREYAGRLGVQKPDMLETLTKTYQQIADPNGAYYSFQNPEVKGQAVQFSLSPKSPEDLAIKINTVKHYISRMRDERQKAEEMNRLLFVARQATAALETQKLLKGAKK